MPFLYKVNIFLPCDPLIPPLYFYPKEKKIYMYTKDEKNSYGTLFIKVKI